MPSFFRRSKPAFDQLDLFSGFTVAVTEPVEVHPETAPTIQSEPVSTPNSPEIPDSSVNRPHSSSSNPSSSICRRRRGLARDFRISDAHRIGQLASLCREGAGTIVAAIRALKAIEAAEREATDDEKAIASPAMSAGARWRRCLTGGSPTDPD